MSQCCFGWSHGIVGWVPYHMGTTQGMECYHSEGTLANNHHDGQSWWGWTFSVQVGGLYSIGMPCHPGAIRGGECHPVPWGQTYEQLQWWLGTAMMDFTQTGRLHSTQNLFSQEMHSCLMTSGLRYAYLKSSPSLCLFTQGVLSWV